MRMKWIIPAVAVLVAMSFAVVLLRHFTAKPKGQKSRSEEAVLQNKEPNSQDSFSQLKWLEGDSSPFDIPVLDCRPVTTTMLSFTKEKATAERYAALCKSDGKQHIGEHPTSAKMADVALSYPYKGKTTDGPVFISGSMEDKWNIYLYENVLYFTRSWTGDLVYRAGIECGNDRINIRTIEFDGDVISSATDAVRAVDFIIKSHLFRVLSFAPVPSTLSNEPKEIALYLFSQYGNWA